MNRTELAALVRAMPASVRALNRDLLQRVATLPRLRPEWLTDVTPLLTVAGNEVTLLLRGMVLPSVANLRDAWDERYRLTKWQRRVVRDALALRAPPSLGRARGSWVVRLTRAAPAELDDDNLSSAFKAVRDAVAAWLGVDDSPRSPVRWKYAQERVKHRAERLVRIDLRPCRRAKEAP